MASFFIAIICLFLFCWYRWWRIQQGIQRKRGEQSFITSPGLRKLSVATFIARWEGNKHKCSSFSTWSRKAWHWQCKLEELGDQKTHESIKFTEQIEGRFLLVFFYVDSTTKTRAWTNFGDENHLNTSQFQEWIDNSFLSHVVWAILI